MAVKTGWTGRVYEDFTVGDIYQHPLGRTVLPVDNSWFTLLTQNMNPIHFDHAYAAQTEFGRPLVDSTFTLALVTGQSTIDLSFNVMANLGWDEVRLPNPLFEGDTVYSKSEVIEARESKSRPNVGIVRVKTSSPISTTLRGRSSMRSRIAASRRALLRRITSMRRSQSVNGVPWPGSTVCGARSEILSSDSR